MAGATLSLTRRNLMLFFRDKAAVFYSLLSVAIIILLYAVFLGDIQVQAINERAGRTVEGGKWLVNAWILAGILAVSTVTVSLGAYGTMVDDVASGRVKDLFVTPIRRAALAAGYMVAAGLVTLIMCLAALVFSEAAILLSGGRLLAAVKFAETLGILGLSVFSFSSLVCFIACAIKTMRSFGAVSTIVGTMIGFFTGIYMPIGILPPVLQTIMKFLPFTYAAVWLRQTFTAEPMESVFAGAPAGAAKYYADFSGINLYFGDVPVAPWHMALIIAGTGIVFFVLSVWRLSRRVWIVK